MLPDLPNISMLLNHDKTEFGQVNHSVCTRVHFNCKNGLRFLLTVPSTEDADETFVLAS